MNKTFSNKLRRPYVYMSSFHTSNIFQRNPWVVVWWSAAFPGAGHLMLCKFLTGTLLYGWEFFINIKAHVNQAIFYSMIGKFDMAEHVLDKRWFLLYGTVYIFGMWDSYRLTTDFNKFGLLADREDSLIMPFKIGPLEMNYLDNRNVWLGSIWSLFNPGLGGLYINRISTGFYGMVWFVITVYYSRLLLAVHATFLGDFQAAKAVLDPQWYLFFPSIMIFATYDVFILNKSLNQLFKTEQSLFLADNYQSSKIKIPFGHRL